MTKQSGFSLVELSIYLVIVGILAVVAVPFYRGWVTRTQIGKAESELLLFKTSIVRYNFDIGKYPGKLEDLVTKPTYDAEAAKSWHTALVDPTTVKLSSDGKLLDPWGELYQYRVTKGGKNPYELYSKGDPEASEPYKIDVWNIKSK